MKFARCIATFALLATIAEPAMTTDPPPAASQSPYQLGQIWTFHLDSSEPPATLTILRVDSVPKLGEIVHISVSAIRVPTGTTRIGHLPMSREAMDRSVLKLVGFDSAPLDLGGYNAWKAAQGGVFTTSVSEAMNFVREAILRGPN